MQIALVPEGFQSALIAPLVESEIARRWWRDTLVEREATLALVDAQRWGYSSETSRMASMLLRELGSSGPTLRAHPARRRLVQQLAARA